MSTYRVETDNGSYDVEVADAPDSKSVDQTANRTAFENVVSGPAAAMRAPFLTNKSPMEGFRNPDSIPTFQNRYSQMVQDMIQKVPGVTSLPEGPQTALLHTASYPAAVAGNLVDSFMNPAQDLAALATPAAIEGSSVLGKFTAQKANAMLKNMGIDFGGEQAVRQVAENANLSLKAARQAFSKSYDDVLGKVGSKFIPDSEKRTLFSAASEALDKTAPESTANKFLDQKVSKVLGRDQLTVNDLHAFKAEINDVANASNGVEKNGLMNLYSKINDVLSSDNLAGEPYKVLTGEYNNFINKEANYVKDLILDKFENVTETKLNSKNMLGIKTPKQLSKNYKDAFSALSGRPTSKVDLLSQIEAVRKGTLIRRFLTAGAIGGVAASTGLGKSTIESFLRH